jgi:hypothetical protein
VISDLNLFVLSRSAILYYVTDPSPPPKDES